LGKRERERDDEEEEEEPIQAPAVESGRGEEGGEMKKGRGADDGTHAQMDIRRGTKDG
jgi:hypothetical protein